MKRKRGQWRAGGKVSKKQRSENQWWDENDGDWYKDRDDQSWYQWHNEKQLWFWQDDDGDLWCARGNTPRDTDYDQWLYYQDDAAREDEIRKLSYKEIRKLFQKNFKYPEHLDNPSGNKKLASAHNYVETQLQGKRDKKVTDEDKRNHNVVLGSVRFFNEAGEKIGHLKIRDDRYPSMNFNMRFSQDEAGLVQFRSYKEAVELMDSNLKRLLKNRPEVLQEESKEFNHGGVYEVIFNKVKINLNQRKSYYEDEDIYKAIFQVRNHSEEALFEYVQSEDFRKKFFDKINKFSEHNLDKIKISLYSTKESCHICQVTLRALKEFIKESLTEVEISPYKEGKLEIPKITMHLSSQEETTPIEGLKFSKDLSPIQSRARREDTSIEANEKRRNRYTVFYNDIKKELHALSARDSASAHYHELQEKYEEQSEEIAKLKEESERKNKELEKQSKEIEELKRILKEKGILDKSSAQRGQSWAQRQKASGKGHDKS